MSSEETKYCEICGRSSEANELTDEDRRRGLHQHDIEIVHCRDCGAPLCGFCDALNVCCE